MRNISLHSLLLILFLQLPANAAAETLMMVRTQMPFEYAMEEVQTLLEEYEYAVAHTQRCDGGLTDFGYKTDLYRVVFFGKIDEVRELSDKHPEIVPFLPLKLLVFAEKDETVLVAFNPETLSSYFNDPALKIQLKRWRNDIHSIFNEMRAKQHVIPELNQKDKNT